MWIILKMDIDGVNMDKKPSRIAHSQGATIDAQTADAR
jgi:hypothetical protein